MVDKAVNDLYNGWGNFPKEIQEQFRQVIEAGNFFRCLTKLNLSKLRQKSFCLPLRKSIQVSLNQKM